LEACDPVTLAATAAVGNVISDHDLLLTTVSPAS
jgi:hypothetical protein